ncbi:replication protein A 70 kDa DNA-binding subunit A-like [Wolffia australiana]
MEGVTLTRAAIADITNGAAEGMKPVLQVADLKLVQTVQNTTERFRMVLSDGVHAQQAMLATQMNAMVKSGQLQKGSIVQLNEFICNLIQNRKIIIVLSLEVIMEKCNPIGEPRIYDGSSAATHGQPPIPPPSSSSSIVQDKPTIAPPQVHRPVETPTTNHNPYSGNPSPYHSRPEPEPQNRFRPPSSGPINNNSISYAPQTAQPTYSRPQEYTNRGPISRNEGPARIVPISSLNPYQGRWTIKARVTSKGELRRYSNPRGEGKVFSFDLLDSEGGEIRATCFNAVADQFFDQVKSGKVYLISRGSLKPVVQRSFNHLNSEYEIFLESSSMVQEDTDDGSIPGVRLDFRPIAEIESMEPNSVVDLAGVVASVGPATSVLRKNGTETVKRAVQLRDMSGRSVELTLWGSFSTNEGQRIQQLCDSGRAPILAVKAARVNDFSGRTVGTISSSQLFVEPEDLPVVRRLRQWLDGEGRHAAAVPLSREPGPGGQASGPRKTVAQIKDEGLGRGERPDWITIRATVTFLKVDNFCYTACPLPVGDRPCNKKVTNNGDGTWRCDRCDQSVPECDYRYLLQLQVQDHTGLTWVTAFQEAGEEMVGATAKELYTAKYVDQDEARFGELIRGVLFREYLLKLKIKEETYIDEQRVKSTVVRAERVNAATEARYLLTLLDKAVPPPPPTQYGSGARATPAASYGSEGLGGYVNRPKGYGPGDGPMNKPTGYGPVESTGPGAYVNKPASYGLGPAGGPGGYVNRPAGYGPGDGGGGQSGNCFKCQQPGHWARDCPGAGPQSYGGGARYGAQRQASQQLGGY